MDGRDKHPFFYREKTATLMNQEQGTWVYTENNSFQYHPFALAISGLSQYASFLHILPPFALSSCLVLKKAMLNEC